MVDLELKDEWVLDKFRIGGGIWANVHFTPRSHYNWRVQKL